MILLDGRLDGLELTFVEEHPRALGALVDFYVAFIDFCLQLGGVAGAVHDSELCLFFLGGWFWRGLSVRGRCGSCLGSRLRGRGRLGRGFDRRRTAVGRRWRSRFWWRRCGPRRGRL